MSTHVNRANEAAEWFLRLKDDDVSESELAEWVRWSADPENLREFQRTRNTWRGFDQMGAAAEELLEAALADGDRGELGKSASVARWWSRAFPRALAAGIVVAVFASGWYAHSSRVAGAVAGLPRIESTELPDGSSLTLAPQTQIAVDFEGAQRRLSLSHGEAYFKVRPDKAKPFIVEAEGLQVTAVGTAFDVRSRADRVVVTVKEGIVDVTRVDDPNAARPDRWRVAAGYQISYDTASAAARIASVDPDRALAWREGRLEYFSEPLGSVVADVNRYSARTIEIGDPQLATVTFTGTVFTASIDDWLGAVQTTFPVRVVVTQDNHVLLLSKSDSP